MFTKPNLYLAGLVAASFGLTACSSNPNKDVSLAELSQHLPAKAFGNEPGWLAELSPSELSLKPNYGKEEVIFTQLKASHKKGVWQVTGSEPVKLRLNYTPINCLDSMTGLPYPWQVEGQLGAMKLQGCAGRVEEVLSGEWQIEDINKQGIIDSSHITLGFDTQEKRVYGSSGCNRYNSNYQLSGEGIKFTQGLSTKMACPEALMNQENKFLATLGKITHLTLDKNGAIILTGSEGASLKGYKLGQ